MQWLKIWGKNMIETFALPRLSPSSVTSSTMSLTRSSVSSMALSLPRPSSPEALLSPRRPSLTTLSSSPRLSSSSVTSSASSACVHNRSLMETRSQHQRTGSDIVPQRLHSPLQGGLHAIYFIFMLWNCHYIPFKSLAFERANYRSLSLSLSLTLVLLFMFLRTFSACFMQFK